MGALTANRNTIKLASVNRAQTEFAILNGEIMYAGGIVALNVSTLEVQMASDAANLVVLGRCPLYVDNTADGEKSNVEYGVFQYNNSTSHALTRAHIGKPCYVEDDNTVSHDPGTYAVHAGIVVDVDTDGVYVRQEPVIMLAYLASQQAHIADAKVNYTTGDLDSEAEIITAINTTNGKINSVLAALEANGILATS